MKVYSEEFKADAVALYVSDPAATYASVAQDLGVNRETLRLWVKQARQARAGDRAPERRQAEAGPVASGAVVEEENRQLRKKVWELEAERDILRRAAKYFAGETNW